MLDGLRVLDLTRLLPGAFCTMLLADWGADVVKVEEPGSGDYMRWTPPFKSGQAQGVLFNAVNRNKRSLTLNLKAEAGRSLFKKLAQRADAVVEGNRPGVMSRLGLGWDVLHELNPKLVLCSITGYGQDGPWAGRAGHDLNYMATAGALYLNGPPETPLPLGVQVADIGAGGVGAAAAILAALLEVARGGDGRHLDVSMTDGALSWLAMPLAEFGVEGVPPERLGWRLIDRIHFPFADHRRGLRNRGPPVEDGPQIVDGRPRVGIAVVEPQISRRRRHELVEPLQSFHVDARHGHGTVIAVENP